MQQLYYHKKKIWVFLNVLDDVKFIDFILDNSFATFAMDDDICFNNFCN
jgi:hypothetical protein